ncbi:glucose-6-phosphate isomerase [Methylobacterium gregans]|uniref:Transaldolase n=1 Tax=Methylobacterium gregans TaxID=374424 RepID=A0AA37MD43_9HYPH|nr:bifunctional transaldolase/phosoglucose isomerase [Methylobacterium gregans]MDQ0521599.1 transaldolase/glucose-6-phosphate isomerase [Methylobacterium gregans]GJD80159.1 Transaldolase [Methylobacterium gregans]GLS55407.1 glucose-6-phosphate isomerase [Methylobacterium gregans]
MNALKALHAEQDQAVWLDFVARGFIAKGELKALVERDGLRGVTSNPSIFEKAIGHSDEYDASLKAVMEQGDARVIDLYEGMAVEDIQNAADVLRPVYEASDGADGYVSLEVSPYLALDTEATLAEARRLHQAVSRDNLMVKVPATPEGIPAIRQLTAEGISINVTLLFSQSAYEKVARAFVEGLAERAKAGHDVSRIASVASFFISRIDSLVDKLLDEKIAAANDPASKTALEALKGKVAIANAKLAYQRYKAIFSESTWQDLAQKGAKAQRLLWASTGTKNKAYSDVLYVEELIGPNTVNTMPPATMDAFRDHGQVRATIEADVEGARAVMSALANAGIDIEAVAKQLVDEGVQLFIDAADKLLGAVAGKRAALLGHRLNGQSFATAEDLEKATAEVVESWRASGAIRRLWAHDKTVWSGADEDKWLGWLRIVEDELEKAGQYADFADWVKGRGFSDAVVLGMGGSSLGPEVLSLTYGNREGFPKLRILDSTHPDEVRAVEAAVDLRNTLFIVASKSGSTLEPNVFRDYFLGRMKAEVGDRAGSHFVAITDPGSAMEQAAKDDQFEKIFYGVPQIGGRYSVLSAFGLVPAAAIGIDVAEFLDIARTMVRSCGPAVPPSENPGVRLGALLGAAALQGRDKVTLVASPAIASFGGWVEQLIAESTGKQGKGLIPIDGEPVDVPAAYGHDRVFVYLRLDGHAVTRQDEALRSLEREGHPVVRISIDKVEQLPQEFFRFEMATAVAGAVIGINPFDQPDVEASKVETKKLFSAAEESGSLPAETPLYEDGSIALYADLANAEALGPAADGLDPALHAHLGRLKAGDYLALLAYLPRNEANHAVLQEARLAVRDARHVATCLEFGPRFLHSTGQAYKGGPDTGVFLQITAEPAADLAIPGRKLGFATVVAAQARGDFSVLSERGRRALRVHIKGDLDAGLKRVAAALKAAIG